MNKLGDGMELCDR